MLYLYQSNRLETLAQMMMHVQQTSPLSSPMLPEQVVIQSQGMRRYIEQFLARHQGIVANMQFSLPAGLAWQLMREHLPNLASMNPFASEVLRWRLLALFRSEHFAQSDDFQAARAYLMSYLNNGDFAQYQLAGELADIFDQYLVYRPDWIAAWQENRPIDELADNEHAVWQKELWQYLDDGSHDTAHRAQLWQDLLTKLASEKNKRAERYCVFGMATLAPMYLTLLNQLAMHSDVHIFALNPCEMYWGDVLEPASILAQQDELALADVSPLMQQGHPLLASLGKQGRDFFNQLTEYNVIDSDAQHIFAPQAHSGSLLHQLQYDIQTLQLPEREDAPNVVAQHLAYLQQEVFHRNTSTQSPFQAALNENNSNDPISQILTQLACDNSIQIHSCHSPLRELQVLKDRLLTILAERDDIQLHDIAVLTSNIEPYAPFIEAVFGKHCADKRPLFYSIADVKRSQSLPLFQALTQLLDVLNSRFEVDKVLSLLDNDGLLRGAGLTREERPLIEDTIHQLNIRWGANQAQRQQFNNGEPDNWFTWQSGLNRIIAGWLLPENEQIIWQGISPYFMNTSFTETMSKLVLWINRLCAWQQTWQQAANVSEWCARTRQLLDDFYAQENNDLTAWQQLDQALHTWQEETELAAFALPLPSNVATQHINRFLQSQSDAGFLRGGITFCSMVPMRSLPFKVLCLLGLNDGDFPRSTPVSSFDLISKKPRRGDRSRRDDDRYLFLEAIMSAREILYLSYIGKDNRTNSERAPSVLLNELIDCLADKFGLPRKTIQENWIIAHPLQAFSRRYFSGSPRLFSTRQDYAEALNHETSTRQAFIAPATLTNDDINNTTTTEQSDFIHFWRNPLKHFLNQRYAWRAPYLQDEQDAAEPFLAENRLLSDAFLRAARQHHSFADTAKKLALQNHLPTGVLQHLVTEEFIAKSKSLNTTLMHATFLPITRNTLNLNSSSLNIVLDKISEHGQILFADQFLRDGNTSNKLEAGDKIHLLLLHLIYCASEISGCLKETHFIQLDNILTLPEIPANTAQKVLAKWLKYYHLGQQQILPFLPRLQWELVGKLKNEDDWQADSIRNKARNLYIASANSGKAFADYDEVKLIWGRNENDVALYEEALFIPLIQELFAEISDCISSMGQ